MRSLLTMLGIIIGIASIIAIVSMMRGTNENIKMNLIGSGNNTVKVQMSQSGYTYDIYDSSMIPKGIPQVTSSTLSKIEDLATVESATSYNSRMASDGVYYGNTPLSGVYIYGIDDRYFTTCNYAVVTGRNFMEEDYSEYRKVMIIDMKAAKNLFADDNPLGKTVEISGAPFTVVGVVKERSTFEPDIESMMDYYTYNSDQTNGMIYIPKSCWPIVYTYDEPENVIVKATSTDDMSRAGKATADILNATIDTSKMTQGSEITYKAEDLMETARQMQQLSNATSMQLVWIAGIALLVGGIGVMNIMLVSVTERTAEIGLKKAIGARKQTILMQFLTEAAVLTSMGGLIGVAAGVGVAYIMHRLTSVPMAIDVPASIIAVVFSMVIGILFGFLPSVQAANLDPIEALRRE